MKHLIIPIPLFFIWVWYALAINWPGDVQPVVRPIFSMGIAATSGIIIVLLISLLRKFSLKGMMASVAILAVFLASLHLVWKSPLGRFKDAYSSIQISMTRAEVEAIIRNKFPHTLPAIHMNETGGYIGPPPGGPNAEFIGVYLKDGRVTGKDYLPD